MINKIPSFSAFGNVQSYTKLAFPVTRTSPAIIAYIPSYASDHVSPKSLGLQNACSHIKFQWNHSSSMEKQIPLKHSLHWWFLLGSECHRNNYTTSYFTERRSETRRPFTYLVSPGMIHQKLQRMVTATTESTRSQQNKEHRYYNLIYQKLPCFQESHSYIAQ